MAWAREAVRRPGEKTHGLSHDTTRIGSWTRSDHDAPVSRPDTAAFIAIDQDDLAPKPASLRVHEAAAVRLVSLAAWQALVDRAHAQPGQKVLVHAGSGGLGSTVIQLAKHLGATVATTASGEKKGGSAARTAAASSGSGAFKARLLPGQRAPRPGR